MDVQWIVKFYDWEGEQQFDLGSFDTVVDAFRSIDNHREQVSLNWSFDGDSWSTNMLDHYGNTVTHEGITGCYFISWEN